VNHPDAPPHFTLGQLIFEPLQFLFDGRLGGKMFSQILQRNKFAAFIQGQSFAAELLRAGQKFLIRHAPVLVAERIITNLVHAAKNQSVLAVNPSVQIEAQSSGFQFVKQWLKDVEIIIAKICQHRG
jgi:hypothetical protein